MSELMTTTYSMWRLFRNCRMACKWRYIDELVPLERDPNLAFGSVIHDCLECLARSAGSGQGPRPHRPDLSEPGAGRSSASRLAPGHGHDERLCGTLSGRRVRGHRPGENIRRPHRQSGDRCHASRSFILAGKVDGIVRQDGQYFLLEHKTASQIDASYLERLWTDFQIILYAWYLEQTLGITVSGIIYNVLVKARLRQGKGETEAEYEARRAELIAKSKTGKSSAKRKLPEDDDTFQQRLQEKYLEPGMFHREMLYISRDQFEELRAELWELSKAMLDARRRECLLPQYRLLFPVRKTLRLLPALPLGRKPQRHRKPFPTNRPARRTAGRSR